MEILGQNVFFLCALYLGGWFAFAAWHHDHVSGAVGAVGSASMQHPAGASRLWRIRVYCAAGMDDSGQTFGNRPNMDAERYTAVPFGRAILVSFHADLLCNGIDGLLCSERKGWPFHCGPVLHDDVREDELDLGSDERCGFLEHQPHVWPDVHWYLCMVPHRLS